MTGDCHVQFSESARVRCPRATRLLSRHGGDLNGFIMLKGDEKKLAEIREEDTFIELTLEASLCLDGFGIVSGYIGKGVTDILSRWSKLIGK